MAWTNNDRGSDAGRGCTQGYDGRTGHFRGAGRASNDLPTEPHRNERRLTIAVLDAQFFQGFQLPYPEEAH